MQIETYTKKLCPDRSERCMKEDGKFNTHEELYFF